jgi:hypothetical protein
MRGDGRTDRYNELIVVFFRNFVKVPKNVDGEY